MEVKRCFNVSLIGDCVYYFVTNGPDGVCFTTILLMVLTILPLTILLMVKW